MPKRKESVFKRRYQAKKRSLNFNRRRKKADVSWIPRVVLTIAEMIAVVFLAYSCVFFFGNSVSMIGDSMFPGIVEEDALLLNKFDYIFRNPKPGDVVAYKIGGRKEASVSVKRIIAVPGDKVFVNGGKVFVNGEVYEESESIPVISDPGLAINEIELGDDEYFVLGDNRNHSTDSRFASVGNVNKAYFLGRVWFNLNKERIGLVE